MQPRLALPSAFRPPALRLPPVALRPPPPANLSWGLPAHLWVVGHTDNTGVEDANVMLSQARAAAVVKALVGMGIAPARLSAHGGGPYAPVAENKTDAGRSKNRRVELVAKQ